MRRICLLFLFTVHMAVSVDVLVFSKDRPLQLYAFLESLYAHVLQGIDTVHVVYHAQNDRFNDGYALVEKMFPGVIFLEQDRENPQGDFYDLVMSVLTKKSSGYVLFAVDDIIITRDIDFIADQALLESTGAYGFYYRLGKNITFCYARNTQTPVPALTSVSPHVFGYHIYTGRGDWGYPNTVDCTLYKKSDIVPVLAKITFFSPNSLEGLWAGMGRAVMQRVAIVPELSKIINIPLNMVQKDTQTQSNRCMHVYSVQELLSLFEAGFKIDIFAAQEIDAVSPHVEWDPVFVER